MLSHLVLPLTGWVRYWKTFDIRTENTSFSLHYVGFRFMKPWTTCIAISTSIIKVRVLWKMEIIPFNFSLIFTSSLPHKDKLVWTKLGSGRRSNKRTKCNWPGGFWWWKLCGLYFWLHTVWYFNQFWEWGHESFADFKGQSVTWLWILV